MRTSRYGQRLHDILDQPHAPDEMIDDDWINPGPGASPEDIRAHARVNEAHKQALAARRRSEKATREALAPEERGLRIIRTYMAFLARADKLVDPPIVELKSGVVPWDHQVAAANLTTHAPNRSAIIVMPCGAGKTLAAILTILSDCGENDGRLVKPVLIVVHSTNSAMQWEAELLAKTTLCKDAICRVSTEDDTLYHASATRVVIVTLALVTVSGTSNDLVKRIRDREYSRIIIDECHIVPTTHHQTILEWKTNSWCALTATPLRADGNFEQLTEKIGEQVLPVKWRVLESLGRIAKLRLVRTSVILPRAWKLAAQEMHNRLYGKGPRTNRADARKTLQNIERFNPTKFVAFHGLIQKWRVENRMVLIFADNVELIDMVAKHWTINAITGAVTAAKREEIFKRFRSREITEIVLSRCADTAIDLPEADRGVQLDAHYGSQRQHVQRVGRLLRLGLSKDGAEFHDLCTANEREEQDAAKRAQFLIDQGYEIHCQEHTAISSTLDADSNEAQAIATRHSGFAMRKNQDAILADVLSSCKRRQKTSAAQLKIQSDMRMISKKRKQMKESAAERVRSAGSGSQKRMALEFEKRRKCALLVQSANLRSDRHEAKTRVVPCVSGGSKLSE